MQIETFIENIKNSKDIIREIDFGETISGDELRGEGIRTLVEFLKEVDSSCLAKINLSNNLIGNEGVETLVEWLKGVDLSHLTTLNLKGNSIRDGGVKALVEFLKESNLPHLTNINLRDNNIGNEGVKALVEGLKGTDLPKLEYFSLSYNNIGDEGVKALLEFLKEGNIPRIKSIDIRSTDIEDFTAVAEARKEAYLPYLKKIYINNIGDEGVKALVEWLKETDLPNFKYINLANNLIGDEGIKTLVDFLAEANLPHLEYINLANSQIRIKGVNILSDFFKQDNLPPRLKYIKIWQDQLSEKVIKEFNEIAEYSKIKANFLKKLRKELKEEYSENWDSIPLQIYEALIDIKYAKLLQEKGSFKAAIDLFGSALHAFKYFEGDVPAFIGNIEQIIEQSTQDILSARDKLPKNTKLPGFVLECFNEQNLKIFDKYELKNFFTEKNIDNYAYGPDMAKMIFSMLPDNSQPTFLLDLHDRLADTKMIGEGAVNHLDTKDGESHDQGV